ncbi:MAG: hypothetical protein ACJ77B_09940 [Chloroflexota bacterium]
MRKIAAIAAAALLFAACGADGPTARPKLPDRFSNAPIEVRARVPLPSCGEEKVAVFVGANLEARRCFWSAYVASRPAEFISTQTTTEGDPITWIYRVLPDRSVEVFLDQTKDKFSNGGWVRLACPGLSLIKGTPDQPDFGPGLGVGPGQECDEDRLGVPNS